MKRKINKKFDRSNFPNKVREQKAGKLIPMVKFCRRCGERNKHHHFLCDDCWGKDKGTIQVVK